MMTARPDTCSQTRGDTGRAEQHLEGPGCCSPARGAGPFKIVASWCPGLRLMPVLLGLQEILVILSSWSGGGAEGDGSWGEGGGAGGFIFP